MQRNYLLIGFLVLLAAVYFGVTFFIPQQQKDPSQNPQVTEETELTMDIQNFGFARNDITVKKGTKVTWVNKDSVGHTVTADDKSFESQLLAKGQSFSFTSDKSGTFTYRCIPHPQMKGTVKVTD